MSLNSSRVGPTPRLAFVTGGLPFGGSTTLLCNLVGELVRQEVPALVLSLEKYNAFASDFDKLGVKVVIQDDERQIFEDRVCGTLAALADFKPTAVISCLGCNSYEILRYVPQGIARAGMIQAHDENFLNGAVLYARFMDAVIDVSEEIRKTVATRPQFRHARHLFLTSGVPMPETWTPRRLAPGTPLRILYLGRLQREQKRVHLFPEIFRVLAESNIRFVWTIVGEGPEQPFLREALGSGKPGGEVRLLGKVPNEAVPGIMEQNDALLLASDYEGLPISLLEAMGHGLVPVVSDLASGIRELLGENAGIKVRPENVSGYAQALISLYRDTTKMEQFSRNARTKVETEFSTPVMARRWLSTFPVSNIVSEWLSRPKFLTPLGLSPAYFSPPLRIIRRLGLQLRSRFGRRN